MTGLKIREPGHHERYLLRPILPLQPSSYFKLKEKNQSWSKIRKNRETPQTPIKDLCKAPASHDKQGAGQGLQERKLQFNPFNLKKELEIKLKVL